MHSRHLAFLLPLLAAAVLPAPRSALAAWPHNPGVNVPVGTATDNQQYPSIIPDGSGGAIVAWTDSRGADSDIYAQHVLASGVVDPLWPADGRALCTATLFQSNPSIASDGAGGAIVTWTDQRSGAYDIYAHHVLASGAVDPAWPGNGRAVSTAASDQTFPTIVPDGAGGAILVWQDNRAGNLDIYAHHLRAGGTVDPNWSVNGSPVCTAANPQVSPVLVADGSGGAVITWQDNRAGTNDDVYVHHVLAAGVVDGAWPTDGRALCTLTGNQRSPAIVSDGAGGAIVTWQDGRIGGNYDIYAQHVYATGVVDGAWPVDGRSLCLAANDQFRPMIAGDGAAGAIIAWHDGRNGANNYDVFAQHVLASGAVDAAWPTDGRALSIATGAQQTVVLTGDDAGAAIVAWVDLRTGASFDIYAQRVARFGVLGTPEPVIASVKDVPNDQGGKVKLSWDASWLDTDDSRVVTHYWILRSVPPAAAQAALRHGARLGALSAHAGPGTSDLFATTLGATTIYWEYVATLNAIHIVSGYSYVASTTGDSIGAYNPATQFMVVAWNAGETQNWSSSPLGGYSVDNVGPATPAPFTGNFSAGATHLHWDPNTEADLANYRLYRGTNPGFTPAPGNQIASPPDTGFADVGSSGFYYKLSAVDVHGNESGFALLSPGATVDVGDFAGALALSAPWPNPSSAKVSLALTLPTESRARLVIHDAAGRRVRQVFSGVRAAGVHTFTWDGRDDAGHALGAGLYFARLEASGEVLVRRLARIQ